jgi:hypothetical protein
MSRIELVGSIRILLRRCPKPERNLFAMTAITGEESRLANAGLTVIDELRDEYGHVVSEPRHSDIETGRSWAILAPTETGNAKYKSYKCSVLFRSLIGSRLVCLVCRFGESAFYLHFA